MTNETDDIITSLFGGERRKESRTWVAEKRFISAEFSSIYDQGVIPDRALSESLLEQILDELSESHSDATSKFSDWMYERNAAGASWAESALDRIHAKIDSMDAGRRKGVFALLADVMDEFYTASPKDKIFFDVWSQARDIIDRGMSAFDLDERSMLAIRLTHTGNAISWLSQEIVRNELWDHGLVNPEREKQKSEWLTTDHALKTCIDNVISRLSEMDDQEIVHLPRFAGILWLLHEVPQGAQLLERILITQARPGSDDKSFLNFLNALRSQVISSTDGTYYKIPKVAIAQNLYTDYAISRLDQITSSPTTPDHIRSQALEIRSMIDRDKF